MMYQWFGLDRGYILGGVQLYICQMQRWSRVISMPCWWVIVLCQHSNGGTSSPSFLRGVSLSSLIVRSIQQDFGSHVFSSTDNQSVRQQNQNKSLCSHNYRLVLDDVEGQMHHVNTRCKYRHMPVFLNSRSTNCQVANGLDCGSILFSNPLKL